MSRIKYLRLAIYSLVIIFTFSNCGSDDNEPLPTTFMKATINGIEWEATTVELVEDSGGIGVRGIYDGDPVTSIILTSAGRDLLGNPSPWVLTEPGTYEVVNLFEVSSATETVLSGVYSEDVISMVSIEGTATITELSNSRYAGSFSFEVKNPIEDTQFTITNGEFSILR